MEMLKGEGDRIVVEKVRTRRECDYCSELATYKNTYLMPEARFNPKSSAYRRDDCTWSSDYDDYLCGNCHQKNETDNVPEGYSWCATFHVGNFPHLFLVWSERELEREELSRDLSEFEGV